MATLKELKEKGERIREEREEAARRVDEAAKVKKTSGSRYYSETPFYASGPTHRGRYADFLRDYTEAQWSGSKEEEDRVLVKHINKLTRVGVTKDNAYRLLQNAWNRHLEEGNSGEIIYIEE